MKTTSLTPLAAALCPFLFAATPAQASLPHASATGLPAIQATVLPAVQSTALPAVQRANASAALPAVQ